MLATVSSSVRPSARLPVVRRRVLVRRPHLVREQPRPCHLVGIGDLRDDHLDGGLRDAGLVEVAQVSHERHHAHRRDDRLPRLRIHAARQPTRQPLPRDAGLDERDRTAYAQHRTTLVHRDRVERGGGRQHRQRGRVRARVVVVATVQQVLEQRRLTVIARRRVGHLDDVGHADLARPAVVAERSPLGVQTARRVRDAALDRHRDVASGPRPRWPLAGGDGEPACRRGSVPRLSPRGWPSICAVYLGRSAGPALPRLTLLRVGVA